MEKRLSSSIKDIETEFGNYVDADNEEEEG